MQFLRTIIAEAVRMVIVTTPYTFEKSHKGLCVGYKVRGLRWAWKVMEKDEESVQCYKDVIKAEINRRIRLGHSRRVSQLYGLMGKVRKWEQERSGNV